MRRFAWLAAVLLASLLLGAAGVARAAGEAAGSETAPAPGSVGFPPLNLELPEVGEARRSEAAEAGRNRSPRVVAAESFAALGTQVGLTAGFVGTAWLIYALASLQGPAADCAGAEGICISTSRLQASILAVAVVAPPLISLLSSRAAFGVADDAWSTRPSWGWTFLSALCANVVVVGLATAFAEGAFSGGRLDVGASLVTLAIGSVASAGVQVTVLNLAGSRVTTSPVVLRDGGGLALGLRF